MELIYKTKVGSHLYGLATENSDVDYKGIFMPARENAIPTEEQILGIRPFVPHKRQEFCEGEGADKVEGTFYSAKYFIELFMKGNPTITELPFCTGEAVEVKTDLAETVLAFVRDNMITRHIIGGYLGYYNSQLKAFRTGSGRHREKRLKERHDDISKGMYDGKMASHAYRLGVQGIELFSTGKLNPKLSGEELEIAYGIKNENYELFPREEMIKIIEDVGNRLEETCKNSPLPHDPDFEMVNSFLVSFQKDYYDLP